MTRSCAATPAPRSARASAVFCRPAAIAADAKLGVGQFARARHEFGRGGECCSLRGKTWGNLLADLQRFDERERVRAGRVRERRRDGETEKAGTNEWAHNTPG